MIAKSTLIFLENLAENNHKEWFDANRKSYQLARSNFLDLVGELIRGISAFDPDVAGLDPKHCVFRINRDIRFSQDKRPYKTNFGAGISKAGRKSPSAGYYLHLEPGGCFLAAGAYQPPAPVLNAIREGIDYEPGTLRAILENPSFKKLFGGLEPVEVLKSAPKGYARDHPALDLLRHKSFIVTHKIGEEALLSPDFPRRAVEVFRTAHPFIEFLNRAIEG